MGDPGGTNFPTALVNEAGVRNVWSGENDENFRPTINRPMSEM